MKKIGLFICVLTISLGAYAQKYKVKMKLKEGTVEMELFDDTPLHSKNFVQLTKKGFYDSLLFHRIIPEFMIQGGDPDSKNADANARLGSGNIGDRIPAEFNKKHIHLQGALAAARDGNPEKASSSCQFYIVTGKKFSESEMKTLQERKNNYYTKEQMKQYETIGGSPHLDGEYTVYGRVTKGYDIINKIQNTPRNNMDRPNEDQRILKMKVKKKFLFFYL